MRTAELEDDTSEIVKYNKYDNIEDFTVDFVLKNTAETSKMDVTEKFTMIFPETNQQHGPVRELFYTSQGGKNRLVENGGELDLNVLMDGSAFPIADTSEGLWNGDRSTIYYIGRESRYLHGKHEFTLSYQYRNVIMDSASAQEIYWNANGTGWDQTFSKVTANLHIADSEALSAVIKDSVSCYVGRYGMRNSGVQVSPRCKVSETDDGYSFTAENLNYGEGLTFAVDFRPGTYQMPEIKDDYTFLVAGGLFCLVTLVSIVLTLWSCFKKIGEKRKLYKETFVKPEYAPTRDLTVAEGGLLSMKKLKRSYVATLLELAVTGKIKIVKGEPTAILKKNRWAVLVVSLAGATDSQLDVLKLLAGSREVTEGEKIEIKRRVATSSMAKVARDYLLQASKSLRDKGLFEKDSSDSQNSPGEAVAGVVIISVVLRGIVFTAIMAMMESYAAGTMDNIVGREIATAMITGSLILSLISRLVITWLKERYRCYTKEGILATRELEGLRLYIGMAEADRLKFLQSVKGADTSSEGIVKLYEKLLPWAALFGLEESWFKELNKYYKELGNPEWCDSPDLMDVVVFHALTQSVVANTAHVASYTTPSGSGGGSSSSFGGGGGGFSGGGGGGGGGGRW